MEKDIFRRGSTTYYWSSVFFPKNLRQDVSKLYSFVRVVDDCADVIPCRDKDFYALKEAWEKSLNDPLFDTAPAEKDTEQLRVVKNMVYVARKYAFNPAWVGAFFDSMESDLKGKRYLSWQDTLQYIYGSAEVIALMMCKLMKVDPQGYDDAVLLGRAMQYINFIRDIDEDIALGRCYFPESELRAHGLAKLEQPTDDNRPAFDAFVRAQIERYSKWQAEAEMGYQYLPRRLLIPVKTAADMYGWTAAQIAADPGIVFRTKVKPSKRRVLQTGVRNVFRHY